MSDILREIEDELRRDNLLKLWQRYRTHVIIAVLVVFAIAGGVVVWRNHLATQRKEVSTQFFGALSLIGQGKDADAAVLFDKIAQSGGGYAVLARFERADLLTKTGNQVGAVAIYDSIAKSTDTDPEYRDLATLLSVMHSLATADPKSEIARLGPLTQSGNAWRPSALYLTAAAELKAGDKSAALAIYKKLSDDLSAPEGLRARATEMAAALAP
ncbi:MAG TPA: tetratricopeptide repeat protein [Stellaceae bacterium]|nr:tetratricopeptide repeat protein [Stellaceae bacterium]